MIAMTTKAIAAPIINENKKGSQRASR